MCLVFFSLHHHPTYKLIVAANRDEFYNRRTAAASFWEDHPEVLGGRDLEAHGTWMAMTKSGKISLLTNYRDPAHINPLAPSRGQLVLDYLISATSAGEYLERVRSHGEVYNGFNLIAGNQDELWYYSNYKNGVERLASGFYGLSNHLLETPWPKVIRGKEKLRPILSQKIIDPVQIFEALYDEQRAEDALLPHTGLTLERERALSSMFIKTDQYGSRCSTVVLIDQQNTVSFHERVYDLTTFQFQVSDFKFQI